MYKKLSCLIKYQNTSLDIKLYREVFSFTEYFHLQYVFYTYRTFIVFIIRNINTCKLVRYYKYTSNKYVLKIIPDKWRYSVKLNTETQVFRLNLTPLLVLKQFKPLLKIINSLIIFNNGLKNRILLYK